MQSRETVAFRKHMRCRKAVSVPIVPTNRKITPGFGEDLKGHTLPLRQVSQNPVSG